MDKFDLGVIPHGGMYKVVCYEDGYIYPKPFDTIEQAREYISEILVNICKYFR